MFREEMKKLYIKNFGLILTAILIIGEIIFVNFLYPKREFSSEITEEHFYEYMEKFSGRLTAEKEAGILAEQERIVDARNRTSAIENRLYNGEYSSEEEFTAEYEENRLITERSEAFDLLFEQYSYALEAPNDRYLTVGDYSGMAADFPDILTLALVIFLTAILFLNEEISGVITFVRISANGKQKTFFGKISAISIFIILAYIFRTLLEFFVIISRGDICELSYPLRTIEFFQNCPYDVTILQGFLAISALRLLGYFFISALIILLSVTLKKALFTIFIPSAICLLQQFAFDPATPAYCIPTGFLRGVGYFRGDVTTTNYSGEEIKIFSEIPLSFLIILAATTIIFIAIALFAAYNYYSCGRVKLPKNAIAVIVAISLCGAVSGCSDNSHNNVKFNLEENTFFTQTDNCFYISSSENILQISKSDKTEIPIIYDVFDDELSMFSTPVLAINNDLYFLSGGFSVNAVSLDDFSSKNVYSEKHLTQSGFLGIKLAERPDLGGSIGVVGGFFPYGKTFYYIYGNRVCKSGKCIIDEEFYNGMISFDGQKIYYVNSLLQLKCYDPKTRATTRLPGEFVRSIYYDGTRLLYSDKNGIFALKNDNSTVKISDYTAERISSDGKQIIYLNGGKLYLLNDNPIDIYDGDFKQFAIVPDIQKLVVVHYSGDYELVDIPN